MIDFTFIEKLEGNACLGYVPNPENSHSGVTIACGFDLGQRNKADLTRLFSKTLTEKLLPYVGLKKYQAQQALDINPLQITKSENSEINNRCKQEAEARLAIQWETSKAHTPFDQLPSPCQTVVASVAFQYGNLADRTPIFWQQVTNGNWSGAVKNLRDFGDDYPSRRKQEARLLEVWLNETSTSTNLA